ncbi:hypothetical protein V6Z12_A02G080300 [Gossypium hirsutum]
MNYYGFKPLSIRIPCFINFQKCFDDGLPPYFLGLLAKQQYAYSFLGSHSWSLVSYMKIYFQNPKINKYKQTVYNGMNYRLPKH